MTEYRGLGDLYGSTKARSRRVSATGKTLCIECNDALGSKQDIALGRCRICVIQRAARERLSCS